LRSWWLHALLFVLTCASTWWAQGPVFAATLMTILLTHEMGHYVMARRHKIPVSLPYFIPVPFVPTGTLGAVIKMKAPIGQRDALVDVGAAGPLAGLAVAIPLLAIGLARSTVAVSPPGPSFVEGNSILYILLKLITHGRYLPAGRLDVQLGPMAFAGWVGILVTFINLIPIGQLDGGHVAYAFFGARYERWSAWLHRSLLGVGCVVVGVLGLDASRAGRRAGAALLYGAQGALPWLVWAGLLLLLRRLTGGVWHPPVSTEPLSRGRRIVCATCAVVFLLIFTPIPMREGL
jgi:membrane-associated protease RseP (regulator of RpoE activity)